MADQQEKSRPIAHWRIVLAAILDFITAFVVFGYLVAVVTGETTEKGFQLSGLAAMMSFALIIGYFWIGRKYLRGTLWQRILKAR